MELTEEAVCKIYESLKHCSCFYSEFDKFLMERASAADMLPSIPAQAGQQAAASRNARQLKKEEEENSLFALWVEAWLAYDLSLLEASIMIRGFTCLYFGWLCLCWKHALCLRVSLSFSFLTEDLFRHLTYAGLFALQIMNCVWDFVVLICVISAKKKKSFETFPNNWMNGWSWFGVVEKWIVTASSLSDFCPLHSAASFLLGLSCSLWHEDCVI